MEDLKGYILEQKGKSFAVVCNSEFAKVVLSNQGAIEEGTTVPIGNLKDFTMVREFEVEQEKPREGGMHCNINVLQRETLLDAQKNPDKYPSLCIRVSGYCLRWNSMTKEQQDDVLSRTFTSKL